MAARGTRERKQAAAHTLKVELLQGNRIVDSLELETDAEEGAEMIEGVQDMLTEEYGVVLKTKTTTDPPTNKKSVTSLLLRRRPWGNNRVTAFLYLTQDRPQYLTVFRHP